MKKVWVIMDSIAIFWGCSIVHREVFLLISILTGGYYMGNLYNQYLGGQYMEWILQYGGWIFVGVMLIAGGLGKSMKQHNETGI